MSQLPVVESEQNVSCCRWSPQMSGFCLGIAIAAIAFGAYMAGRGSFSSEAGNTNSSAAARFVPPEYLNAAATHGASNLAVCTGRVDEDAEGFFVLDYLTGELKAWVYYPRAGTFGGYFMTNVQPVLGVNNKNPEYLLVTGDALTVGQSSNVRPAQTLVYVVDARSGFFAAYTIPWNRTMANSNAPQNGTFTMVGGGQIREPQGGAKKPINPPKAPGPGNAAGAAPGNNAGAAPGPQPPVPGKQP